MSTWAVEIELPDDLVSRADEDDLRTQVARRAREALLVTFYDQSRISTSRAASLLGISRREFLDVPGRYGVSEFDDNLNVVAEARLAYAASSHQSGSTSDELNRWIRQ